MPIGSRTATIRLTAADPELAIASAVVNWGDGNADTALNAGQIATLLAGGSVDLSHSYALNVMPYTVTFTVIDNGALQAQATAEVLVENNPPTFDFTSSLTRRTVTLTPSANDEDGTLASIVVDWGDDSDPQTVTNGEPVTHDYPSAGGVFTILGTATDAEGATGTHSTEVSITANQPPSVSVALLPASGDLTAVVLPTSEDVDGSSTALIIRWGDGIERLNVVSGQSVSHTYSAAGDYNITAVAIDDDGVEATSLPVTFAATVPQSAELLWVGQSPGANWHEYVPEETTV